MQIIIIIRIETIKSKLIRISENILLEIAIILRKLKLDSHFSKN